MQTDTLIAITLSKLGISEGELRQYSEYYNGNYSSYGNEVYEDMRVRLVHLENFLQENWWNNRFHFLWKSFRNYEQIIDIGFSVPYLPLKLAQEDSLSLLPKMIYVDTNETSKKLAEVILDTLGVSGEFVVGSATEENTWNDIEKLTIPGKKLFTAFETIEHFEHPELFWKELSRFKGNDLTLSLPIGEKIPSHHSVFMTEAEVTKYLEQYLDITEIHVFDGKDAGSNYKIYTAIGNIK